jgi:hypothetical protein
VTGPAANVFWSAKDERSPGDWEDGAAFDPVGGRMAVADGASAAYRAREWATHLVESWVKSAPMEDADPAVAGRWFTEVASRWKSEDDVQNLEWYHQDAARRGSFAAFVGVQLTTSGARTSWTAVAVGDCCLFQVRGDRLLTAFPLSDPAAFGNAPDLVPSAADKLDRLHDRIRTSTGIAEPGDLILLCSDAFAKFLLTVASDGTVWAVLRSLVDNHQFGELVSYLRAQGLLELDDVTLLRVRVTAG